MIDEVELSSLLFVHGVKSFQHHVFASLENRMLVYLPLSGFINSIGEKLDYVKLIVYQLRVDTIFFSAFIYWADISQQVF